MNKSLLKYQLGLAIMMVFSLVLLVIVLTQAGSAKQDGETYDKATKVANALDTYAVTNGPPDSLAAANIKDVPPQVSYTKLDSSHYQFCVNYKSDGSSIDATAIETQILTGGMASKFYSTSGGETSFLYLNPSHHKGNNCQKVKAVNYNASANYNFDTTSATSQSY